VQLKIIWDAFFVLVCSANSILALSTGGDTLDEYDKFRNQEKQILFVDFTTTQLPHCEIIVSTKLFIILHNGNENFRLHLQQRSRPTDTFFNKKKH